ncbi:glycosyltransferase [Nocardia carnea]|uniref:glycosyltransferase n=1 Tax=Nocardia carnea TaxID=37328 RepID=UPI00245526D6|nr:glycosyltransferase [Nocardia carnea]
MVNDERAGGDDPVAAALHDAVHGLRERRPEVSAAQVVVRWQSRVLAGLLAALMLGAVFARVQTLIAITVVCTAAYVWTLVDRLVLFFRGLDGRSIVTVTDVEAESADVDTLPAYTILVPAFREPEVIATVIDNLAALRYPADKLQILLLLEADDDATIAAARAVAAPESLRIVEVPPADPRTKPKACNFGLHFATGDIVTIYDAEDRPDPLQLRRAAVAFDRLPENTACVQARLAFHNGGQNLLTAWFTADYALWFGFILPGLMRGDAPIPLGGTSNHLRRDVLDEIGAWDPFNVTEDADLGVRIAESGYRTAVLDSVTWEEANSDPVNWIRQRSRWYKGYLQTWLVHMRRPVRLWRMLGPSGFARFTTLLAGTPLIACLNMLFWLITLAWLLGQPHAVQDQFPPYVYFPALFCLVFGNAAVMYMNLVACRESRLTVLLLAALTTPLYWVLMSVAAIKGVYQLISKPSYWEKTFHGLPGAESAEPAGTPQ